MSITENLSFLKRLFWIASTKDDHMLVISVHYSVSGILNEATGTVCDVKKNLVPR